MVVPFGAGGGTDTQYRGLKPYFDEQLGVSTVVDNRPGATGRSGFNYMSQQDPNGYTLGCISVATGCLGQRLYDTQYDLKEASKVGISTAQYFAAVAKAGRFGGPKEFADWAKNAEQVKLGSVGVGGSNHFLAVSILDTIGVSMDKVTSVPYDSGPEIAAAVARGEVDFGTPGELGTKSLQQKGDVDVLWIARPDQSSAYPDKPVSSDVAKTLGVDSIPDWGLELGIFGPAGIESQKISTLEEALLSAVENQEFQSWAKEQGLAVMAAGSDDLSKRVDMYLQRAQRYQELVDVQS